MEARNANSYVNFPFAENSTLQDVSGSLELRPKVIVDFVSYGTQPERTYYLARTEYIVSTRKLTFYFQDDLGNGHASVHINIPFSAPGTQAYTTKLFKSSDWKVKGRVTFNMLNAYILWYAYSTDRTNYFSPASTVFEPGVVVPEEASVTSLNTYRSAVKLKEGYNFKLVTDPENKSIELNAIDGAGQGKNCTDHEICYRLVDPDGDGVNEVLCGLTRSLGKLGGATADENCEVFLKTDNCLRILAYPEWHMLVIHNECTNQCDEAALIAEAECRVCKLLVKAGLQTGDCSSECCEGA